MPVREREERTPGRVLPVGNTRPGASRCQCRGVKENSAGRMRGAGKISDSLRRPPPKCFQQRLHRSDFHPDESAHLRHHVRRQRFGFRLLPAGFQQTGQRDGTAQDVAAAVVAELEAGADW